MKRKLLIFATFACTSTVLWLLFRRYGTLETLVQHEARIRSFLSEHMVAGMFIGFLSYVLLTLVPGTAGKSVVCGWLFGLWPGVVISNCALTVAAIITFLISRSLLRESLQSRFALTMDRLDKAVQNDGAFYLFALRMMNAPYTATNYAMGTTCISVRSFWWATQLGLIPGTIVFAFAGTQIPTLRTVIDDGLGAVFSTNVIGALVLIGLFPLVGRWGGRKISRKRGNDPSQGVF